MIKAPRIRNFILHVELYDVKTKNMRSLLCEILKIEYAISDHAAPSCALPPAPLGAALARTRPSPLSQSRARPAGPLRTLLSRYSGVLLLGLASWVGGSAPRPSRRAPPAARSPTARIFPSRPHSAQKTRRRGHAAIRQAPRRHLPRRTYTLYTLQLQHEHIMAISKRHSHAPRPCHRSRTDMTHRTHPGALLITTFASTGAYSTGTHRHRSGDIGRAVTTSVTFMKCSAGIIMDYAHIGCSAACGACASSMGACAHRACACAPPLRPPEGGHPGGHLCRCPLAHGAEGAWLWRRGSGGRVAEDESGG